MHPYRSSSTVRLIARCTVDVVLGAGFGALPWRRRRDQPGVARS